MGGGFIISAKKMRQCIPSSETSEPLWKKSNVFGKKSNVFAARSEVETLVGGFWGANAGQKEESRGVLGEKMGGFEGEVLSFCSRLISPK